MCFACVNVANLGDFGAGLCALRLETRCNMAVEKKKCQQRVMFWRFHRNTGFQFSSDCRNGSLSREPTWQQVVISYNLPAGR